jgi:hypothetical protein
MKAAYSEDLFPAHLDLTAKVLRAYINLIYSTALDLPPHMTCQVNNDTITALLSTSDRYDTSRVDKSILRCLKGRAGEAAWAVFGIASQRQNLELARTALRNMNDDNWKKLEKYDEMDYEVFEVRSFPSC